MYILSIMYCKVGKCKYFQTNVEINEHELPYINHAVQNINPGKLENSRPCSSFSQFILLC